jgi:hypothetical protein
MPVQTMASRASRMIARLRRSWAEMDDAQRRMFELRTGLSVRQTPGRADARPQIEELEALYALEAHEPDDTATY